MAILGIGHDVVNVHEFTAQCNMPGTRMRQLFSARELRQAYARTQAKHDGEAQHLAARWAGKESVIKAWCEALAMHPLPYTLDTLAWNAIEIIDDERGVPHVYLAQHMHEQLVLSLNPVLAGNLGHSLVRWHVTLSHDDPVASAFVILESV